MSSDIVVQHTCISYPFAFPFVVNLPSNGVLHGTSITGSRNPNDNQCSRHQSLCFPTPLRCLPPVGVFRRLLTHKIPLQLARTSPRGSWICVSSNGIIGKRCVHGESISSPFDYNSSIINRAPVEILCKIFLELLRSQPSRLAPSHSGPYRRNTVLPKIIAVCRRWRSAALECAVLWTNIAFSTTLLSTVQCAQLFLSRSKDAMLSVYILDSACPAVDPEVAKASQGLLKTISSQSHRISLCELSSSSPDFWRSWVLPAPNLLKLVVKGCCIETPPIFGGVIPRLQILTSLNHTAWPLGNYATLRKAELQNYDQHPSLTALLDALQGCEVLEKLILHGYTRMSQVVPGSTPILLPRLHQINLLSCDSALILECLDAPSLSGPVVIFDTSPRHHILQSLPSTQDKEPYLKGIVGLHVVFETHLARYHVSGYHEGGRLAFSITAQGVGYWARWTWTRSSIGAVASSVYFSNIRTLTFVTDCIMVPWGMWLPNLSHVRNLSVSCPRSEGILCACGPTKLGN